MKNKIERIIIAILTIALICVLFCRCTKTPNVIKSINNVQTTTHKMILTSKGCSGQYEVNNGPWLNYLNNYPDTTNTIFFANSGDSIKMTLATFKNLGYINFELLEDSVVIFKSDTAHKLAVKLN